MSQRMETSVMLEILCESGTDITSLQKILRESIWIPSYDNTEVRRYPHGHKLELFKDKIMWKIFIQDGEGWAPTEDIPYL
jgi:hypothetical protein